MTFLITSLYPFLGHNFNMVLQYLKPRYLSLYASTSKQNLEMIKKYFIYVKEIWLKRGMLMSPLHLHYNSKEAKFLPIEEEIINKCIVVAPRFPGNYPVGGRNIFYKKF